MTAAIGPRRKAPPVNRPPGFEPEYDAFEPRFRSSNNLLLVIFGLEVRAGDATQARERLLHELGQRDGPDLLEHGMCKEGFGPQSAVWFAYWRNEDNYHRWCRRSDINALLDDESLLTGDVGIWREFCRISLDYNETSYSRRENLSGIAGLCDALEVTPIHGYWGSARDRIVAAADDPLAANCRPQAAGLERSLGRRIQVEMPDNVCLIKTTQDLFLANEEQLAIYHQDVEPAMLTGLRFLRDNPEETGCIGIRFIEEAAYQEAGLRTLGLGYFESLDALEQWTHHHWTHQRIMQRFISMVERFEGQPGLHLWHEISVFEAGSLKGDYVNCSPGGTLLQYTPLL